MKKTQQTTGTPVQGAPETSAKKRGGLKKSFSTRQFRRGGWATLASVLALAAVVVVNLVVGQLPTGWTTFDLTDTGLYSIGEQTRSIVSKVSEPVTLYLIASKGNENSVIKNMLQRYAELSDEITVKTVDPTVYPKFVSGYTSVSTPENSVIVESAKRSKVISYSSIYVTDYQYSQDYTSSTSTTTFEGENQLTSAIDFVTSDTLPVAYYLTGHGEPGLDTDLQSQIEQQNISVQDLTLLNADAVPDDCSALIIDAPTTDLYESETQMILDYLAGGGKLVLLTDYTEQELPNLRAITDAYHVSLQSGVVMENDRNYYYQYPYYLLPEIKTGDITGTLASNKMYVLMYMAQGILTDDASLPDTETVTPLLTTSDNCYSKLNPAKSDSTAQADGDPNGPFNLGVLIESTIDDNTKTGIVWYSTGYLLNTKINGWVSGNNFTLFVNTLGYLCQHTSAISIEGKSVTSDSLILTSAQAAVWKTVYTVLLPLLCAGVGIFVCVRRRRRV